MIQAISRFQGGDTTDLPLWTEFEQEKAKALTYAALQHVLPGTWAVFFEITRMDANSHDTRVSFNHLAAETRSRNPSEPRISSSRLLKTAQPLLVRFLCATIRPAYYRLPDNDPQMLRSQVVRTNPDDSRHRHMHSFMLMRDAAAKTGPEAVFMLHALERMRHG